MAFSLIAAFIFAPWLAMRVRPQLKALEKAEQREHRVNEMIGRFYNPCMRPLCNGSRKGKIFLYSLITLTFLACAMFYTNAVTVKMLPFDNKPEFNVVINMPEGTALPVTANVTAQLSDVITKIPEVTALQSYVGTASPFNFNGMVRHYYLRQQPWESDIQVMLLDKEERELSSHAIAVIARKKLNDYIDAHADIKASGVRIQIVEMPPGPPVLQTVVAEIYGPDAQTRRQVATEMTEIFQKAEGVVDVDNYMIQPHKYWRFEVDTEKAVRQGISVDTINNNLEMALGGYKLGDVKRGVVLEPTYIVIQVPLESRAHIERLNSLPISSPQSGKTTPLAELGRFTKVEAEQVIYHKDLRSIEYVTGEMEGRLGAPIYGMFNVEDMLENYKTPDGVTITGMPNGLLGPPDTDDVSGFEWTGEWTVTYETFRDMGLAFMAALLFIYALIVWEFKNFKLAGLIMAPIPLTLIGIIPGHWVMSAEFTATSMIGFIALAGIIVRNSILMVEFVIHELKNGVEIKNAVINAGQIRMRPIFITALTLMAGAFAIIFDPIFQGMAVSLLFGTAVATVLTLVVIPLGCITARKQFYILLDLPMPEEEVQASSSNNEMPLWMVIWSKTFTFLTWVFYALRAVYFVIQLLVQKILEIIRSRSAKKDPDGGGSTPPVTPKPDSPDSGTTQALISEVNEEVKKEDQPPAEIEAVVKKEPVNKTSAKTEPVKKAPAKAATVKKAPAKAATVKKAPAKAATVKKEPVKKAPAKTATVKKEPVKKAPAKAATVKKEPVKKAPAKAATVKKEPVKEAPAKKKTVAKKKVSATKPAKKVASKKKPEANKKETVAAKKKVVPKRRGIRLKTDL